MEKKHIKFKVDKDKVFELYVGIMNPFLKLSNRESEVLSRTLALNYKYRSYSDNAKWTLVFSTENRKKVYNDIGISVHQYNNILSAFRKKKLLLPGNILTKKILIYPDDGLSINFEMSVVNEALQETH